MREREPLQDRVERWQILDQITEKIAQAGNKSTRYVGIEEEGKPLTIFLGRRGVLPNDVIEFARRIAIELGHDSVLFEPDEQYIADNE